MADIVTAINDQTTGMSASDLGEGVLHLETELRSGDARIVIHDVNGNAASFGFADADASGYEGNMVLGGFDSSTITLQDWFYYTYD